MLKIGFLGSGRIAQALAKGFITAGLTKGNQITASAGPLDQQCIDAFQQLGATASFDNKVVIENSDVILIAVKPFVVPIALSEVRSLIKKNHLFLSVAMGVSLNDLQNTLPEGTRVLRVMTNTPANVGCASSVIVKGKNATKEDLDITRKLFECVGLCDEVPENLIDPITALSGSGPAYIYVIIEALADGAVRMGIPRDLAYRLAAQTVKGAGKMVLETKSHPAQLKDNVTSPGGTTAAALHQLELHGVRGAMINAIEAATMKSREQGELGKK